MHLETAAVDLGGKLTSGKPDFGAKFGHSVGDVGVKSGYGRSSHVEAICQILFGHVVGFVSQSALPLKHQNCKRVLASYLLSIWGSNARMQATFWAPTWSRP